MKRYVKGLLGAVLMGATLWLGGCASVISEDLETPGTLSSDAKRCSIAGYGRDWGNDIGACIRLVYAYSANREPIKAPSDAERWQQDAAQMRHYVFNGLQRIEVAPNEEKKKAYLNLAIKLIREQNNHYCYLSKSGRDPWMHGEILEVMKDEIHQCIMSDDMLWGKDGYLERDFVYTGSDLFDSIEARIWFYKLASFSKERIIENLKKDYPLKMEFYTYMCDETKNQVFNISRYQVREACKFAYNTYSKGASYEGAQVFAPQPDKAAALAPLIKQIATYDKELKAELARQEAAAEQEEREFQAQIAKEEQYRKNLKAAAAKDCKTKYKNAKICEVAAQEMLRLQLDKEGLDRDSQEMFDELKDEVASYNTQTLRAIVQEITNKPKHKYKGVSYCTSVMPYVWNAFYRNDSVSVPAAQYVAGVCGN